MARKTPAILVLTVSMASLGLREAASAVIPVTSLQQKISSTGGCSLQEAIFSANFDNNVAVARYSGSTPIEVVTQCVPGSGDDIIVLPANGVLELSKIVDDHINAAGPTATPIITSNITILGYGAILERASSQNFRLFTVGNTGHLTIRRAYIRGFLARGGNGGSGGGGGLGAGGAIFVMGGTLVIEASTFEGNGAFGGSGSDGHGGGGGGIGGFGASERDCSPGGITGLGKGGGGGGGARGPGGPCVGDYGGGGGGTLSAPPNVFGGRGFACGGKGGAFLVIGGDGEAGQCPGGGGGGGGSEPFTGLDGTDGGKGHYGGGGGGGAYFGGGGGASGGFGGGGGASGLKLVFGGDGGNGGFGAGGGAAANGSIFDGDGGNGGFFAGDGSGSGGGGGAGLGGAIFNDSGTVLIQNSTFTANAVGGGFSAKSQDGSGGGGAIFSVNGHLTVLNSTISGNLANFGGGIVADQDSESAPTSFVLENTIVANNGQYECAISGFSIGVAFAGNLIESNTPDGSEKHRETFAGCGGVVSNSDPQLGPLAYNQGATPTMAIGSTSPAWNAADPGSSLAVDQRRQDRPAMGGFDIDAFELCVEGFGNLQMPCVILAGIENPGGGSQAAQLTIEVNPPGAGTTTPAPGTQELPLNSVVPLTATPSAGFRFTGWSQNVTNPGNPSTTVFMNASQTVTANFALCACAADVTSAIGITFGGVTLNPMTRRYVQTVTLRNNSAATIAGPISLVLDKLSPNVTLYNATGNTALVLPADSPYINANIVNLAAGQSVALQLQFTNPGNIVFSYDARVLAGPGSR